MPDVQSHTEPLPSQHRSCWPVAFALTTLVAVAGLMVALQQFVVKYLWDQSAHTRTIGGVPYLVLGVVGLLLPILLWRSRREVAAMPGSRQWLTAVGLPLAYVLAFAACWWGAQRSTTLILPRPFVPTAVLRYNPGNSRVEFRGGWKPRVGPGGYNDAEVTDGVEHFSSYLYQGFLRYPDRETVAITGRAERLENGRVQVTLNVDAKERLKFAVENLDDVTIVRDGKSSSGSSVEPGEYEVVITGRPREGT